MIQRHFSVLLLAAYTLFAAACLSRAADPVVRSLRHAFFYLLSPAAVPPLAEISRWGSFGRNLSRLLDMDREHRALEDRWRRDRLDRKRLEDVEAENRRLLDLLGLPPRPSFDLLAARVLARDPRDSFQGLMLARGAADGVEVSDPVAAFQAGREVLAGRVAEVEASVCRVVLVTDPLSSVSAKVERTGEQGAAEGLPRSGTAPPRLAMNYLFSDSAVRPGDAVVTAGLGGLFPPGILLGEVESVEQESRETFKRAILKPAFRFSRLEEVYILRRRPAGKDRAPRGAP
ncbi:MAG: rod shape-determining protein MreC [Elusimicrobiota bacterium]